MADIGVETNQQFGVQNDGKIRWRGRPVITVNEISLRSPAECVGQAYASLRARQVWRSHGSNSTFPFGEPTYDYDLLPQYVSGFRDVRLASCWEVLKEVADQYRGCHYWLPKEQSSVLVGGDGLLELLRWAPLHVLKGLSEWTPGLKGTMLPADHPDFIFEVLDSEEELQEFAVIILRDGRTAAITFWKGDKEDGNKRIIIERKMVSFEYLPMKLEFTSTVEVDFDAVRSMNPEARNSYIRKLFWSTINPTLQDPFVQFDKETGYPIGIKSYPYKRATTVAMIDRLVSTATGTVAEMRRIMVLVMSLISDGHKGRERPRDLGQFCLSIYTEHRTSRQIFLARARCQTLPNTAIVEIMDSIIRVFCPKGEKVDTYLSNRHSGLVMGPVSVAVLEREALKPESSHEMLELAGELAEFLTGPAGYGRDQAIALIAGLSSPPECS